MKITTEGKGAMNLVWDMPLLQMGNRESPPEFYKDPFLMVIQAGEKKCDFRQSKAEEVNLKDHPYARTHYEGECESRDFSAVQLQWFPKKSLGQSFPLYLLLHSPLGVNEVVILEEENAVVQIPFQPESLWKSFWSFFLGGIHHILGGVDHVLFVITLLLPSVCFLQNGKWMAQENFRASLLSVAKVVTAFTVAHSLTLSVVALGWLKLPARPVEVVIALSVLLAALNNLRPMVEEGKWKIAFAFGLFHGIGFAEILSEMLLPQGKFLVALFAYNVGVEIGQLAIIFLFFPILFLLRKTKVYEVFLLKAGSSVIAAIALLWVVERVLGLEYMPF